MLTGDTAQKREPIPRDEARTPADSLTNADARELTTRSPSRPLLAGVAYGTFSYCLSRIIRTEVAPTIATGAMFGAGSLPLLLVAGVHWLGGDTGLGGSALATLELDSVLGLSYLVAGPMVLSYLLYGKGLVHLSSSVVLVIALVEPAVATLLAVAVVGERFGPIGIVGLLAVTSAVVLAGRAKTMR